LTAEVKEPPGQGPAETKDKQESERQRRVEEKGGTGEVPQVERVLRKNPGWQVGVPEQLVAPALGAVVPGAHCWEKKKRAASATKTHMMHPGQSRNTRQVVARTMLEKELGAQGMQ